LWAFEVHQAPWGQATFYGRRGLVLPGSPASLAGSKYKATAGLA
jgi:hypothetical protein